LARSAVGARLEIDVALAALAALGEDGGLLVVGEIDEPLAGAGIGDHRAGGHAQHHVLGALAAALAAAAPLAVARAVDACEAVLDQGVDVAVRDRDHAAAPA